MRNRWSIGIRVAGFAALGMAVACGGDDGAGPGGGVASVSVTPAPAVMFIGETVQLEATPRDANNNPVSGQTIVWTSSNFGVLSLINATTGLFLAQGAGGPVTITASVGTKSGTTTTTVETGTANPNCTSANASPVTLGVLVTAHITTNDCVNPELQLFDYWTFTLTQTTTIQIDLASGAFDPFLELFNSSLSLIASDDDNGPGTNSLLVQTLNAGTYYLGTRGFDPTDVGPYTLLVAIRP